MNLPPKLDAFNSVRPISLFPITRPQPPAAKPRRRHDASWRPTIGLVLTICGLLFATYAMHREAALLQCPTEQGTHG